MKKLFFIIALICSGSTAKTADGIARPLQEVLDAAQAAAENLRVHDVSLFDATCSCFHHKIPTKVRDAVDTFTNDPTPHNRNHLLTILHEAYQNVGLHPDRIQELALGTWPTQQRMALATDTQQAYASPLAAFYLFCKYICCPPPQDG